MRQALGIDIGGTKIGLAAVTSDGTLLRSVSIPTNSRTGFADGLNRMVGTIEELLQELGWKLHDLAGVGIGCAGPLDPLRGIIDNPYTLPGWEKAPIVQALSDRLKIPVRLENDADAALVGECRHGAGRSCDPVVMLTFGTGVGGAVWADGKILRGAQGQHPELGHLRVTDHGPTCYCGRAGCLEVMASGTAIGELGRQAGYGDARKLLLAARNGDVRAAQVLNPALEAITAAIWNIAHVVLPSRLVLGGGVMEEHYAWFASRLTGALAGATQFTAGSVQLAQAELGNQAGLVGAACLLMPQQEP